MASRRTFLKAGVGASLALALGGGIYRATRPTPAQGPFALSGEARAALNAIVPVMLEGALPAGAASAGARAAVVGDIHRAVRGLPLATQKEVQDLFGLLALAPGRRVLTGVIGPWSTASPAAIHAFLQDWRTSPFGLLRAGYAALHDLILGAWYAAENSWDAIGYPGPPLGAAS